MMMFSENTCCELDYEIAGKIYGIDYKAVTERDIADAVMSAFVSKQFESDKNTWSYTFCWNNHHHTVLWVPVKHVDFAYNIYVDRYNKEYQHDIEEFLQVYRKKVSNYSKSLELAYQAAEKVNVFQHIIFVQKNDSASWNAFLRKPEVDIEKECIFSAETLPALLCKAAIYVKETIYGSTFICDQFSNQQPA